MGRRECMGDGGAEPSAGPRDQGDGHGREGSHCGSASRPDLKITPRTDSLHVRKMCAALQHASAGEAPILMRREEAVGHGARSATRETVLLADILSFAATFTGLTQIHHGHAPATENDARQDQ